MPHAGYPGNRVTEYITGAAMMEPDIREVTNVQGFCYPHFP